jgi:hypothetical protein
MTPEKCIRKDLERNSSGLIEVLYRHLTGGTMEKYKILHSL